MGSVSEVLLCKHEELCSDSQHLYECWVWHWVYSYNPSMRKREGEDPGGWLASWSGQISKRQDQGAPLSPKIRWRAIEEDIYNVHHVHASHTSLQTPHTKSRNILKFKPLSPFIAFFGYVSLFNHRSDTPVSILQCRHTSVAAYLFWLPEPEKLRELQTSIVGKLLRSCQAAFDPFEGSLSFATSVFTKTNFAEYHLHIMMVLKFRP